MDSMKVNVFLKTLLLGTLLTACLPSKKAMVGNFPMYVTPPNGIKIADNLFCDQTEIMNIGWREFMYWNKHVFGEQSIEYASLFPDTLVGASIDSCLGSFLQSYWRDPAYDHFPVVGITQEQAIRFSTWRADRVFEALLSMNDIIKYDTAQHRDNYFTIERYYKGELDNVVSDRTVAYYPEFRLPNLTERISILAYADSLDNANIGKYNSTYCANCKAQFPEMWRNATPCTANTFDVVPTGHVYVDCPSRKWKGIFHLRGNVAEWASETNIAVGGSWKDHENQVLGADTITLSEQNAWTGFRNVFVWKKWME